MAKYDDDDDDDMPSVRRNEPLTGMNGFYGNTNIVVLILFSLCCNGLCFLPLILSIVGVTSCTDEKAKSNAKMCLIISAIMTVIGVIGNVIRFSLGGAGGMNFK
jgi:hypothetical protein